MGVAPVAIALAVLLLAEVAVRLDRSHLTVPDFWPAPELEDKYQQSGELVATNQQPDVVLAGDSMMDAGGDPTTLSQQTAGLRFYNAALSGQALPVIADWTSRIIMPRLDPKVVVVGLTSAELSPFALDPNTGVKAYRSSRVVREAAGTGNPVDRADAFLRDHSMLYRYRTSLRRPFTGKLSAPNVFEAELTPAGQNIGFADQTYLEKGGPARARALVDAIVTALAKFSIGSKVVALLEDMITEIRRKGARVLLVAMPVTADFISFHPRNDADYQDAMDAFAGVAERTGVPFFQPGTWPTAVFADPLHLNAAGAAQFSTYLAPLVRQEVAKAGHGQP